MHPTEGDMDTPRQQQEVRDALAAQAYSEGRRAGLMRLSPELNPYLDPKDPLHEQWERGRFNGLTENWRSA